jgi:hypothetical protein
MVAQEILILFVIVRIYVSHQIFFMTDEVVLAKINQLRLSSVKVEPIKKESKADRILFLIYQNQQKLKDAKRKRKWYQIF